MVVGRYESISTGHEGVIARARGYTCRGMKVSISNMHIQIHSNVTPFFSSHWSDGGDVIVAGALTSFCDCLLFTVVS